MKNFEELPEEIFDILATKKFSELTLTEQQKVRAFLSPENYDEYHLIVKNFQSLDASMGLEKPKTVSSKTASRSFWQRPIPLYQVAAILLLWIVASFFIFQTCLQKKSTSQKNSAPIFAKESTTKGKSLAEDKYPEALVINF